MYAYMYTYTYTYIYLTSYLYIRPNPDRHNKQIHTGTPTHASAFKIYACS